MRIRKTTAESSRRKLTPVKARIDRTSPVFRKTPEVFDKHAIDFQLATASTEPVEMRAVWISNTALGRLDGRKETAKLLSKIADAGFNSVIPEVIFRGNTLYPGPFQDDRFAAWPEDAMSVFTEEAGKLGLQVHAWVWGPCVGHSFLAGKMLLTHPEWLNLQKDGSDKGGTEAIQWFDPAIPEVRKFLIDNYMEVLERYDVAGLHLDYMRYNDRPSGDFGYTEYSMSHFKDETGIDALKIATGSEDEAKWIQWREKKVTAIVEELAIRTGEEHPGVVISGAVGPNPVSSRRLRMQNWEYWAKRGWLKLAFPMTYTSDADVLESHLNLLKKLDDETISIYPGLGAFMVSEDEIIGQIEAVREAGYNGLALFAGDDFTPVHYRNLAGGVFRKPAIIPNDNPKEAVSILLNRMKEFIKKTGYIELPASFNTFDTGDMARLVENVSGQKPGDPASQILLRDLSRIRSIEKTTEYRKNCHPEADPGGLEALIEVDDGSYDWLSSKKKNLARTATISVDSNFEGYSPEPLNNGVRNNRSEEGRWTEIAWASAGNEGPHWIELFWEEPQTIQTVNIFWAQGNGKFYSSKNYRIQAWLDEGWESVYDCSSETGTFRVKLSSFTFVPVTTRGLRIYQSKNGGPLKHENIMWVSEIEVY